MGKPYNLEDRTMLFAESVRTLIYKLPKSISNMADGRQLVRSSGSVAANYIEANEHLSDKDFDFRIKICRKEAKESILWRKLLQNDFNKEFKDDIASLIEECIEHKKIFSDIVEKRKKNNSSK